MVQGKLPAKSKAKFESNILWQKWLANLILMSLIHVQLDVIT